MKIDLANNVRRLHISKLEDFDPILVYIENYGKGQGRITIASYDMTVSNYWGAMGENHTMESFFLKASTDYLSGKLKPRTMNDSEIDFKELVKVCRQYIIEKRRECRLDAETARDLYDRADELKYLNEHELQGSMLEEVCSEWWEMLPYKDSSDQEYLERVINYVKEAIAKCNEEQ